MRQTLQAIEDTIGISEFVTTVASFPGNLWYKLSRSGIGAEFSRRSFDSRLQRKTIQFPWFELGRLLSPRIGFERLATHERGVFCVDRVYSKQDRLTADRLRHLKKPNVSAVYCYEDGASETFSVAKELGIKCIYDLPTGYWRAKIELLTEEKERQPEWACLLPGLVDSEQKNARKDKELRMADIVISASTFTNHTLMFAPIQFPQIRTIAYGAPQATTTEVPRSHGGKLRVLYVGSLSQQKGLSYLFEALDLIESAISVTIVGRMTNRECRPLNEAIGRSHYIPSLPHPEVLNLMEAHDVFIFPSLFDGFGLVVLEAMSRGLAVIASTNCGAPDVITDGKDGFIVPIRDSQAIAEKLELLHSDRERLREMKEAARMTAARVTWAKYRQALVQAVRTILS